MENSPNYNKVQKFLRLAQYLALYMPDIMVYTTLLSGSVQNNQTFQWIPLLDKCFQSIKVIAMRLPILKPVDFNRNEPVWVITDGSWTGISVMYGQGKSWDTCRPAGFLSKKFTSAQHNYHTHKHETLAVLEALMKWEDKLLGRKFMVAQRSWIFQDSTKLVAEADKVVGISFLLQLWYCFGTRAKTVVFKAKTLQPWQTVRVKRSYENIKPCCSTTPEIIQYLYLGYNLSC